METCKLMIQIPCYNEEKTLPEMLADLPKELPGITSIEVLVINDGSTDNTVDVARGNGVKHIVSLTKRKGLAAVFSAGIDASLKLDADIIVNTDADNQYRGEDIGRLVKPIIEGKADLVIGNRKIEEIKHFSFIKKKLQRIGSRVVRYLSGLDIPDATTGFRAYSRDAAIGLNVISEFTYTLETIIAAGNNGIAVENIEISTNPQTRKSRLFRNIPEYITRSIATLIRVYTMYRPLKVFARMGAVIFLGGILLGTRFLYFFIVNKGAAGHIQSLILSAVLLIVGFQIILLGMLADLIAANRRLAENTLNRIKRMELNTSNALTEDKPSQD
ncbi:MAG: glycosyltransferase family 2 protein [Candidatus Omnitrophica bacterium]|nr:glycosyltransferase family 2 protein [Candidatus Omnitrophota bacterium]MBU1784227.1 glycosyltransferase family 2 protein [Candidatus Omnitrophota bacterium]